MKTTSILVLICGALFACGEGVTTTKAPAVAAVTTTAVPSTPTMVPKTDPPKAASTTAVPPKATDAPPKDAPATTTVAPPPAETPAAAITSPETPAPPSAPIESVMPTTPPPTAAAAGGTQSASSSSSSSDSTTYIIIGAVAGGLVLVGAGVYCCRRGKATSNEDTRKDDEVGTYAPPAAASTPVRVLAPEVQPPSRASMPSAAPLTTSSTPHAYTNMAPPAHETEAAGSFFTWQASNPMQVPVISSAESADEFPAPAAHLQQRATSWTSSTGSHTGGASSPSTSSDHHTSMQNEWGMAAAMSARNSYASVDESRNSYASRNSYGSDAELRAGGGSFLSEGMESFQDSRDSAASTDSYVRPPPANYNF
ncbi:Aste57867_24032 [Aphanomyces stellatus]|uniref:Aste57867_24032 protein n=1 Tax=Aphanomyces stellatus TaxID=120398 RepID=A0A485LPB5_9STRA|nr:hypothetical protein As57867_023959 [Aphanomyces stellatus]VFU00675.1 Aste57867_24032 [Aphanomyces stellatus]